MIMRILSFMASMYEALGPGILLTVTMPLFAIGLIVVVQAALKRPTPAE
ncbi:MAG: hypothetical protein OEO79_17325 [Gemmatimonadota bacterium]|nr:hypothetical protein [Gemmatimonadota bacterium]